MRVVKRIVFLLVLVTLLVFGAFFLGRSYGSVLAPSPNGLAQDATCCSNVEPYPHWLGRAGLAFSSTLGRVAAVVVFRDGFLMKHPDAAKYLTKQLQPLDLIAIQSDGHLSHRMVPGKFGHIAVYLGNEAELKRAGLWEHPMISEHHEAIKGTRAVLEADRKGVHLATFASLLDADSIALLRPKVNDRKRQEALVSIVGQLGTPFDFRFDADDGTRLFCAELIAQAIPALQLPKCEAYGRLTILPDQVAYLAAADSGGLSVVGYVSATALVWEQGHAKTLRTALDQAWAKPVFR